MNDLTTYIRTIVEDSYHVSKRGGYGSKVNKIVSLLSPCDTLREVDDVLHKLIVDRTIYRIGYGSFRDVYYIDEDHVLKVPSGESGTGQNWGEMNPKIQSMLYPFVPKVYAADEENGLWIIAENVPKTGKEASQEWMEKTGLYEYFKSMDDFQLFSEALIENYYKIMAGDKSQDWDKSDLDEFMMISGLDHASLRRVYKLPIIRALYRAKTELDVGIWDLKAGNIGIASDGRPVIIDLGV